MEIGDTRMPVSPNVRISMGMTFFLKNLRSVIHLDSVAESVSRQRGNEGGALLEAKAGDGRRTYVGLGLWRQLPGGFL